ncbi:MAG: carbohydrate kinase family protein [Kiritimatiellia bacterium]|nr:PfkB family carbohydrate kinase [Lentisphaerota bacterium]
MTHKTDGIEFVGLGYCAVDYLCRVPRIPLDDKVEIEELATAGGGPAATATVAAQRLGARTAFVGAVGDDERGRLILEGLARDGVDTHAVRIRAGAESPVAFCWIERGGRRSIAWTRGSVQPLSSAEVDTAIIRGARLLHLDGHQTEAAIHAAGLARKFGVTVSLDAGTLVPGIETLVELSDIVIASAGFAERFTGETEPERSLRKLFGPGRQFAGITMGIHGSIGFDGTTLYRQTVLEADVVDTTGAGDTFHGAFACQLLRGGNWAQCLRFASAAAALKCERFGGRLGVPTLAETTRFLNGKDASCTS